MSSIDHLSFFERPRLSGDVSILGIPLDLGKDGSGTADAPQELRKAGLVSILKHLGFTVHDLGDIPCPAHSDVEIGDKKMKYANAILPVLKQAAASVANEIEQKKKVIAIGGDHTIALGTISGAAKSAGKNLGVIWIDAHADANTPETTLSGNLHGMPSAALMGFGHSSMTNLCFEGQKISPENILFIGLKDLDQAEIELIRKERISVITIMDLMRHGFGHVTNNIDELTKRTDSIWVSLDVDGIDREDAPGTLMAAPNGLTRREIIMLTKYIGKTCPVIGMDIVELVPHLDQKNKTISLALELIVNLLGSEYGWYTEYMKYVAYPAEPDPAIV